MHGGFLVGVEIIRQTAHTNLAMMDKHQRIDVNDLHKNLSHASEVAIRNTATMFGWILKNTLKPCEDCAIAKAKQKNIKGNVTKGSNIKGERFSIDISSIQERSFGGAKYWNLVVDEATNMKWSLFLKQKSDLGEKMQELLLRVMNQDQVKVQNIRCDNAGENHSFEQLCKRTPSLSHIRFE